MGVLSVASSPAHAAKPYSLFRGVIALDGDLYVQPWDEANKKYPLKRGLEGRQTAQIFDFPNMANSLQSISLDDSGKIVDEATGECLTLTNIRTGPVKATTCQQGEYSPQLFNLAFTDNTQTSYMITDGLSRTNPTALGYNTAEPEGDQQLWMVNPANEPQFKRGAVAFSWSDIEIF